MDAQPIYTIKQPSIESFMRLVYGGGIKINPTQQRQLTNEDQCSELVNLVKEMKMENKPATEADFLALIYEAFIVTPEQMQAHKSRKRELVYARQLHMVIRKHYFNMSNAFAGEVYGKDHATVMHATRTVLSFIDTDKQYREQTIEIWQLWKAEGINFPKGFNSAWL